MFISTADNKFTVIASPFRANMSMQTNMMRLEAAMNRLTMCFNITNMKTVLGVYQEEGQEAATREVSIKMDGVCWPEVKNLCTLFCEDFEQDCILVINNENGRCALWSNSWSEELGFWTQVTAEEAHEAGIYTLDTNFTYWLAK
ncbi:S-adenosyl-L-methionine hydrolase [Vibrio phage ICP3]|uniref:Putative S-adenosyl-L-methionine hydrolase n=3 Tax=Chatterjeevirus ICP3 TaxID=2733612 RepID=A0A2D0Z5I5_9CAUD|nr:putative S-adenosyl-L-methionine hydrolase [Vibrio phage JSF25]ASV42849.1 putative S-adenosyl-L-methionine hydrolase [Vibrio phage JSF28]ASV43225.1 putative S-adenosyl-L-methionine hydrolase [Vibrio phage JSF18]USS70603.1 S-adenosyl-L-methionine hydrolase [Vibrio phage ICP3]USS70655.1 S-adenosyl-L-methionine hydrolase [Vibrio phage ICP3]